MKGMQLWIGLNRTLKEHGLVDHALIAVGLIDALQDIIKVHLRVTSGDTLSSDMIDAIVAEMVGE